MGDSWLSRLTGGLLGGSAAGAGGKTGGSYSSGYRAAGGAAFDPIAEARALSARSNAARRPSAAFALSDSGFNSFRGSLSAGWKAELVSWRFRQAVLAELVGSFLFVAIGTLSVMTTLPGSLISGSARQDGFTYQMRVALTAVVTRCMSISFVFGLALVVLIFSLGSACRERAAARARARARLGRPRHLTSPLLSSPRPPYCSRPPNSRQQSRAPTSTRP